MISKTTTNLGRVVEISEQFDAASCKIFYQVTFILPDLPQLKLGDAKIIQEADKNGRPAATEY